MNRPSSLPRAAASRFATSPNRTETILSAFVILFVVAAICVIGSTAASA